MITLFLQMQGERLVFNNIFYITCAAVFASLFAGLLPQTASAETLKYRIGYWYTADMNPTHSMTVSSMNRLWGGLTHLIIGDLYPNSDGTITFGDSHFATNAPAICNAARANGVQCIIDIAALGPGAGDISGAVRNNLSGFISNLVSIMDTYGFVGVSTDWEVGWSSTLNDSFTHALRSAVGSKLILEGADWGAFSYFGGPIQSYIDGILVGGYDQGYCSSGGISWFNAALYNDPTGGGTAENAFSWEFLRSRFINAGLPSAKFIMGTTGASVGYGNVSAPRQACSPPGPSSVPGTRIDYRNVVGTYNISNPNRDSVTHEAWINVDSSHWLDVQDGTSLTDKVHYLQQHNLGGFGLFNLFMDYVPSQNPQHPLLAAMEAASGISSDSAPSITSTSPLSAGAAGRQ